MSYVCRAWLGFTFLVACSPAATTTPSDDLTETTASTDAATSETTHPTAPSSDSGDTAVTGDLGDAADLGDSGLPGDASDSVAPADSGDTSDGDSGTGPEKDAGDAGAECASGTCHACGDALFPVETAPTVPAFYRPLSIATADFDGDGNVDMVTAHDTTGGGTIAGMIGISLNKSGVFALPKSYDTGPRPSVAAPADLNGDGKPDLVTVTSAPNLNTASVLLNDGTGGFPSHVDYTTGANPAAVAFGDFNGDGKLDLAVANGGAPSVSVLLNNGAGTFAAKVDYATGGNGIAILAGDFNGDGKPDIASLSQGARKISILLNNGSGFAAPADFQAPFLASRLAMGDINGDGNVDIAAAVANGNDGSVTAYWGQGNGSFVEGFRRALAASTQLVVADLNNDKKLDLATATGPSVNVLLNAGAGTFGPTIGYHTPSSTRLAVGDYDGDGTPDILAANFKTGDDSSVSLLRNDGAGAFNSHISYDIGVSPAEVAVGDFDGDGHPDLATANTGWSASILLNDGTGGFSSREATYPVLSSGGSPLAVDVNRDGLLDLVMSNTLDGIVVTLNKGGGVLGAKTSYPAGLYSLGFAAADFDSDGYPDVAIANHNSPSVSVEFNNKAGGFIGSASDTYTTSDGPSDVATADFNGDGKPDIALATYAGANVFLNTGKGKFAPQVVYKGSAPIAIATGDFNGDGAADIVAANNFPASVSVFLNKGNGTFSAAVNYATQGGSHGLAVADLNLDGRPDVVTSMSGGTVSILINKGGGVFTSGKTMIVNPWARSVSAADMNGDGKPDLIVSSPGAMSLSVYMNATVCKPN